MTKDLTRLILEAHERSFQRAFEIAVRTGTDLIFSRNGKIIRVKPPFRYELVPIKQTKKKKKVKPPRKK